MQNKTIVNAALAGVLALGLVATASTAFASKHEMEKCYGVVKAGKNDCGAKDGSHSCAGHATKDGDPNEWISLPKGTCEKLVGGIVGDALKTK